MRDKQEDGLTKRDFHEAWSNGHTCSPGELRDVASQFVADLIIRAKEMAQRQQLRIDEEDEEEEDLPPTPLRHIPELCPAKTPPEIQIDLVGSRTPSPEEVATYVPPPRSGYTKKRVFIQEEPEEDTCADIADLRNDPQVREYAFAYIKGIVEQAAALAQERIPVKPATLNQDNAVLSKAAGPWYSRIRSAVTRCLRTGCLCVVRRQPAT
ncbi:uncharacterized protein LOC135388591 [Ornithodoros turicata]